MTAAEWRATPGSVKRGGCAGTAAAGSTVADAVQSFVKTFARAALAGRRDTKNSLGETMFRLARQRSREPPPHGHLMVRDRPHVTAAPVAPVAPATPIAPRRCAACHPSRQVCKRSRLRRMRLLTVPIGDLSWAANSWWVKP